MQRNPNSAAGHKRKISYADLALTYNAAGPLPQPHPNPQQQAAITAAQLQAQQLEEVRRRDLARRQSRKPTDRDIPDDVADAIVGDGVQRYKRLREVERRLDAVMMRKRLDVKDNAQREYAKREGTLRLWISNTVEGQPWQVIEDGTGVDGDGLFELGDNSQATFRVKIEGRLLDDTDEDEPSPEKRPRLSDFFKAITIDFDRNPALMPDGFSQIEWRKQQAPTQAQPNPAYDPNSPENSFDCLEFERKGDENVNVTINLTRDTERERYKLSPGLAEILDTEEDDMLGTVQGIWEYARAMHLQEDDDKRTIVCDEPLRRLFNQDRLSFPYLPDILQPHLKPLPPLKLPYTIRVDKSYISPSDPTAPSQRTIYDLTVPLPNPTAHHITRYATSKTHLTSLSTIIHTDDNLALLVQKLHATNAKRKFYENLAKDPRGFVGRWVGSQKRDLEVILAEAGRAGGGGEEGQGEEWRKGGEGGVWGSVLARESVGLWCARQGGSSIGVYMLEDGDDTHYAQ
ncbi:hypothetical protein B0A48_04333 [Cryoendolithus antarcticus]|uniref:DM2 domain-containing protein n=1 Tax=Cryoendolithus antarcticus TaxID=1507870 RepID=A0A1V8TFE3_9PEZI|nr:hypothetical protein B0A48_04333 [Cryoendolithus antarcticus]